MSKISLEPNDSGAGTFSIVSPDSNTNRTLNLPDEAGKLLSTGNNDPAEVFKQSNILGTVSESGGVPTGAIIERDSNANGEYVKYADGTMICSDIKVPGNFRENPSYSSIGATGFRNTIFTFPAEFLTLPVASAQWSQTTGEVNHLIMHGRSRSSSRFQAQSWLNTSVLDSDIRVLFIAIGRWY